MGIYYRKVELAKWERREQRKSVADPDQRVLPRERRLLERRQPRRRRTQMLQRDQHPLTSSLEWMLDQPSRRRTQRWLSEILPERSHPDGRISTPRTRSLTWTRQPRTRSVMRRRRQLMKEEEERRAQRRRRRSK